MSRLHTLLALGLSVVFGLGWVFGKAALDHFPPVLMAAFRFGCAGLAMLPFCKWPQIGIGNVFLVSALAIGIPYGLSNFGLSQLDVSITVLLVQLEAPILILMSAMFLKEIPSRQVVLGVVLAFCGVTLVAGRPVFDGSVLPIALTVASMIVWATGQLCIRRLGLASSFGLLAALSLAAVPQLVLASLILETDHLQVIATASWQNWMQVVYLGLAMTAGGIGVWYALISRYEISLVAPFLLLVPAVSILGGVLFLGEVVDVLTLAGGAVIVAGVSIATFVKSRPASNPKVKQELADERL